MRRPEVLDGLAAAIAVAAAGHVLRAGAPSHAAGPRHAVDALLLASAACLVGAAALERALRRGAAGPGPCPGSVRRRTASRPAEPARAPLVDPPAESEQRLRRLADGAPVMLWLAGPDGARTWCNRRWPAFTGRAPARELGRGWADGLHPDDASARLATAARAIAERHPFEAEYRLRRHDGSWRWLLEIGTPLFEEGERLAGFVGVAIDVTERRAAEQELLAQRELAHEASHARDEFLATVSHELRTPLAAMLGWARLLRTGSLAPARAARALETIERCGRAQAQIIDDMLDISHIVSGRLALERAAAPLAPVVAAALEQVRPAAAAKGVVLQAQLDPQAGAVWGDAARLQQVAWNLLSNAVKFTPEGGRVRVELAAARGVARLVVRDSGIGIAPGFLPHLFERFRQADGTSTRAHGGLGLGLAIVHHLVGLHGGAVRADSPGEGGGATFTVELPLHRQTSAAATRDPAEPDGPAVPALAGCRILVVDDDLEAREVLVAILQHWGAEVVPAGSVREALGQLERLGADVVVSDIAMPGEDGFDLIRRMRAAPEGHGVPAVAVTAFARGEERQRILDAGFQRHLAKPVEPEALLDAISALTHSA